MQLCPSQGERPTGRALLGWKGNKWLPCLSRAVGPTLALAGTLQAHQYQLQMLLLSVCKASTARSILMCSSQTRNPQENLAPQPSSEKAKLAIQLGTEVLQLLSSAWCASLGCWQDRVSIPCQHPLQQGRMGSASPAAGHRAPRVSHWALAAHPLQDLGNHCPSLAWLLGKNKKRSYLSSMNPFFSLLIM